MRKILLSTLMISLAFTSFAQDSLIHKAHTKAWYLKKSRQQKIIGASLITVGAVGLLTALSANAINGAASTVVSELSGGQVVPEKGSSASAYLISMPCLIGGMVFLGTASESKKKAVAMTMRMEETNVLKYGTICKRSFPTVGIKIRM